jgi:hypothetical protein
LIGDVAIVPFAIFNSVGILILIIPNAKSPAINKINPA